MIESYFLYLSLITFLFVYFGLSNEFSSLFASSIGYRSVSFNTFRKKQNWCMQFLLWYCR